jgi:hypothetical protein
MIQIRRYIIIYLLEEEESWETLNSESFGNFLLLCGVDLSEVVWRIVLGKSLGGLSILGGKLLAVTTIQKNTC